MEFLVHIQVTLPPQLTAEHRSRLMEQEAQRGGELKAAGSIVRIWRIPGRQANVGMWEAPDATALHEAIRSLPMFPYLRADVTPLAIHPIES